jgi:quercetin dioxygenase-like cupin family protein
MKLLKTEEYIRKINPNPAESHRETLLTSADQANDLSGIFVIMGPGQSNPYHYHKKRESLIMAISGEAVEVYEGKESPLRAGDVLFIPPGKKHRTINRSNQEFRYLEYYTCPPGGRDFVEVGE